MQSPMTIFGKPFFLYISTINPYTNKEGMNLPYLGGMNPCPLVLPNLSLRDVILKVKELKWLINS